MDKSNLPVSQKKRSIQRISNKEESLDKTNVTGDSGLSVINLPNGSSIMLNAEHIGSVIEAGSRIIDGIISIQHIREQGTQAVALIRAEIEKMYAEADIELKKKELESQDWHQKFDKKREVFFDMVAKIEKNPDWSDETKTTIIKALGKMVNEE